MPVPGDGALQLDTNIAEGMYLFFGAENLPFFLNSLLARIIDVSEIPIKHSVQPVHEMLNFFTGSFRDFLLNVHGNRRLLRFSFEVVPKSHNYILCLAVQTLIKRALPHRRHVYKSRDSELARL